MDALPPATQALCQQCSAPLTVEQGTAYTECQFCGATNVLDRGRSVFHYVVRETVRQEDAEAMLRRWMGGNKTVKDLDKKAIISQIHFQLFPMWLVRVGQQQDEAVLLEPAAAISVSELKQLKVPAADLEPYDAIPGAEAVVATVPYNAMLNWLADDYRVQPDAIREAAIVHLPIYLIKYSYKSRSYTAVVDAATGEIFCNIYPSKWEAPYQMLGAIAFVVYFLAALAPVGGYMVGGDAGLATGLAIFIGLAVVAAVPIVVAAMVISARV